jgi:hypothetical protein
MKSEKCLAILATTIIFSMNVYALEIYIVKKGDTLSSILFSKNIKPIYGKRGALASTLKLNPNINVHGGYKIFPSMRIILENPKISNESVGIEINSKQNITPQNLVNNDRFPSDSFKQSFYWEVSPIVSWKYLTSSDENVYRSSSVSALSNTSFGFNLAYGMNIKENLKVFSRVSLESVSFVQDASVSLTQKKLLKNSIGIGFSYEKKWIFELAMSDEFFLTSPSQGNIDIKNVTLPEFKTTYLKDFYHYRNANFSFALSASAFLPRTSPDIASKFSYGAGGALEAKLQNQAFKVGYDLNLLKATGNSTNSNNIYWKYVWETL